MGGHAQTDAILAAGDDVGYVRRTRQDQRERAGPERRREPSRGVRDATRPLSNLRGIREMHDDRMIRGPTLGRKDPAHRGLIRRIGPQSVHRFRGERDELSRAQAIDGAGERSGCRRFDERTHGRARVACGSLAWSISTLSWQGFREERNREKNLLEFKLLRGAFRTRRRGGKECQ